MSEEIISRLGDDVASELTLENFLKCGQLPFEENPYAKKTTHGAKAFMVKELKALKMKTAGLDNAERCKRLLCHYNSPQLADPQHYNVVPRMFYHRLDFWMDKSPIINFLNKPQNRMSIIFALTWFLHYLSSELYVTSFFGLPRCSVYKAQPHCYILHNIQTYTFSSLDDFGKVAMTLFLNMLYGQIIPKYKKA